MLGKSGDNFIRFSHSISLPTFIPLPPSPPTLPHIDTAEFPNPRTSAMHRRKRVDEKRRPRCSHAHVNAVSIATISDSRELLAHVE